MRAAQGTIQSLRQIFKTPLLLAVITAAGLVSALVGDDLWDALSWAALAIPLVVAAWAIWGRPAPS
jgi:hypothetical protein